MNHLTPEVQRMLAADNISGAISALGGHKENKSISEIIIEKEEKAITEIKALDTYWSDHCRHTTFLTELSDIVFEGEYKREMESTFLNYLNIEEFIRILQYLINIIYANLPDVEAITNGAYVNMKPTAKCVKPTKRACTIDKATGLSRQRTKLANGVRSCAHTNVSINSCQ